jgi:hypothetical protein
LSDPKITPSILATLPDLLKAHLIEISFDKNFVQKKKSILISSNSLANKFIFTKWGIRPSQRRRYRNLFSQIRNQSRSFFQHILLRNRITVNQRNEDYTYGIFKFDEVRGNLILGFVLLDEEHIFVKFHDYGESK